MRANKPSLRLGLYLLLLALLSACGNVKFSAPQQKVSSLCNADGDGCDLAPIAVKQTVYSQSTNKVDVLFVIDSSGSMDNEREALGSRLANFTGQLGALDWQICVTTTDISRQAGNLLPFTLNGGARTNVLTSAVADHNNIFLNRLTSISGGSGDEQGIASMNLAVQKKHADCFRNEAALATIVISDEDERSVGGYDQFQNDEQWEPLGPNNMPSTLIANVKSTFSDQKVFTNHSIVVRSGDTACEAAQKMSGVRTAFGTWYEALSRATGGVIGNLCSSDYAVELQNFASNIRQTLASVTLKCAPVGAPSISLTPAQPGTSTSVQGNKVVFSPALPVGTRVDLEYMCPGDTNLN